MGEATDSLEPRTGLPDEPRRGRAKRGHLFGAAGLSLAAHLGLLVAIISAASLTPPPVPTAPAPVDVMGLLHLAPAPPRSAPAKQTLPPKPPPRASLFRPTPARAPSAPLPAEPAGAPDLSPGLSDAALAGATTAGSGSGAGGGGACDMAKRVQDALRRDPLVQTAIAPLSGKALMIWDGDWVWLPGEDGRGLTAVRQAMMWEIAFSPSECRGQTVHGLVVLSPTDANGSTRLALGGGVWRWSDLLTPHPGSGSAQP